MKAPEVPPLLVRASDQSPKRIAGRLSKFLRWSEIGADPWVMRIVQWGVQDPLCNAAPTEISGTGDHYPKGSLSGRLWTNQCKSCGTRGVIEPAPPAPRLLQPLVPCHQGNMGMEADHRSILPQCLRALPPVSLWRMPRSILGALQQGQWLTFLDLKDAFFHRGINPADRRYLRFCHNGTTWQFTVLPCVLSTSPRVFTKILEPVLAYTHLHRVKLHMYLDDWLWNSGTHQEALEQTSWLKSLCRRLGLVFKPREIGSNPISGCHLSGDRVRHSCRPGKAITQESDQLAIRSGGIHGTAVTTCCPVAPSTWTPSLSRETSALWSNSHSSHSMAIETPLDPVEGEILKNWFQ